MLRGLYAVTDPRLGEGLTAAAAAALRGGARLLQYRDKTADAASRLRRAATLQAICAEHGAALIVNDDVDLAARVGAAGVHLGREDTAIAAARARLGPGAIIGASCYDRLDLAAAAAAAGADYVAFGSFFSSPTKPAARRAPLALLREARASLALPLCAIGGVTRQNAAALIGAGADLLAVISDLFDAPDVEAAARAYARLFEVTTSRPNEGTTGDTGKAND